MKYLQAAARQPAARLGVSLAVVLLAAAATSCGIPASDAQTSNAEPVYDLEYRVRLDTAGRGAHVTLRLRQAGRYLRELDMPTRDGQIRDVKGDGEVSVDGERATWLPPSGGGTLSWFARLEHRRGNERYDAWVAPDWALFRGEDIVPSGVTRTQRGARSRTRLVFELPAGWSSVTPYGGRNDAYEIANPARRFATPTGWMVAGRIGVRNEHIAGRLVKIAGPTGHGIRRLDMLALLRWTMPDIVRLIPDFPERLTIVSAGEPMWRGALSGPQSLYMHAERPLISENGTSTLLHEVMHVGLGLSGEDGADWIVEGIAEYYSLELLRRTGTLSEERYAAAHEGLARWGRDVEDLCLRHSTGAVTARAVTVMSAVAAELARSGSGAHLDDIVRDMAALDSRITVAGFREIVADKLGRDSRVLAPANIPGCD